jgi:hypothetical protein
MGDFYIRLEAKIDTLVIKTRALTAVSKSEIYAHIHSELTLFCGWSIVTSTASFTMITM